VDHDRGSEQLIQGDGERANTPAGGVDRVGKSGGEGQAALLRCRRHRGVPELNLHVGQLYGVRPVKWRVSVSNPPRLQRHRYRLRRAKHGREAEIGLPPVRRPQHVCGRCLDACRPKSS
jgi:hypothetical protein